MEFRSILNHVAEREVKRLDMSMWASILCGVIRLELYSTDDGKDAIILEWDVIHNCTIEGRVVTGGSADTNKKYIAILRYMTDECEKEIARL